MSSPSSSSSSSSPLLLLCETFFTSPAATGSSSSSPGSLPLIPPSRKASHTNSSPTLRTLYLHLLPNPRCHRRIVHDSPLRLVALLPENGYSNVTIGVSESPRDYFERDIVHVSDHFGFHFDLEYAAMLVDADFDFIDDIFQCCQSFGSIETCGCDDVQRWSDQIDLKTRTWRGRWSRHAARFTFTGISSVDALRPSLSAALTASTPS